MGRKKKTEVIEEIQEQEQKMAELTDELVMEQEKPKTFTEYIVTPKNPASLVNARSEASLDAPIVKKLKNGEIVKSDKKPGKGWIQIELDNKPAFVMSTKLKKK